MWAFLILLLSTKNVQPALLAPGDEVQQPAKAATQTDKTTSRAAAGDQKAAKKKQDTAKPAEAPADAAKGDQAKPDEKKTDQAEPKPAPTTRVAIDLGVSAWNLTGNDHKLRQYATPPRGIFLSELLIAPPTSLRDSGYLDLRGLGQADSRMDGRLALNYGRTQAESWLWHAKFYDPTPVIIPDNDRDVQEHSIKQLITRDSSISFRYRMIGQDQYFEPPRLPIHQRTRYWDAIAAGKLGPGTFRLGFTDWRYFDRTDVLADTAVSGWRAAYALQPTPNTGLEANYIAYDVKQSGQSTGHVDIQSVSADATVGDSTDLGFLFRRDHLTLPQITTAYAREQRSGTFGIAHRFLHNWNAKLSFQEREVERVRGDQTFVDVPRWATVEGSLYGRIMKTIRLTARGYTQSVSNIPPMVTVDTRSLYWDKRQFAQVKLERGNQDLNSYFVWSYRNWDNNTRAVHLNFNSFVLGSSWQATPALGFFAEYTKENWNGSSEIATAPTFQSFLPDSHIITAGLNWMINERAFMSLSVTNFGTANDNPLLFADGNTSGTFFTLNARYAFPSGAEIGFIIAPWSYHDDVIGNMNYNATIVMLTGKAKF